VRKAEGMAKVEGEWRAEKMKRNNGRNHFCPCASLGAVPVQAHLLVDLGGGGVAARLDDEEPTRSGSKVALGVTISASDKGCEAAELQACASN